MHIYGLRVQAQHAVQTHNALLLFVMDVARKSGFASTPKSSSDNL